MNSDEREHRRKVDILLDRLDADMERLTRLREERELDGSVRRYLREMENERDEYVAFGVIIP